MSRILLLVIITNQQCAKAAIIVSLLNTKIDLLMVFLKYLNETLPFLFYYEKTRNVVKIYFGICHMHVFALLKG